MLRKGPTTIAMVVNELERTGEAVHASERLYYDRINLAQMCTVVTGWMAEKGKIVGKPRTLEQKRVYSEWREGECVSNWVEADYEVLDSIKFIAVAKRLPVLTYVTL